MSTLKVCVVGGGIAGLTAAYDIRRQADQAGRDIDLTLYESSGRLGGKMLTSAFAGFQVDEGADAFITRVSHALVLAEELGLTQSLVSPATSQAYIWSDTGLKPILKSQILGVPLDLDQLEQSGLVSQAGVDAARQDLLRSHPDPSHHPDPNDRPTPTLEAGATVGSVVRQRLGDEVAEKLVFPLIGSINAGNCDYLDVRATAPMIAQAAQRDTSLIRGLISLREARQQNEKRQQNLARQQNPENPPQKPIFLTPKLGMEEFARALAKQLKGKIALNRRVASVDPHTQTIVFDDDDALPSESRSPMKFQSPVKFDAAVLATPAWATAQMLRPHQAEVAALLSQIDYCSVAIVTVAFNRKDVPHKLDGSGFVVPYSYEDRNRRTQLQDNQPPTITACSWASSKWAHLSGHSTHNSPAIFRVSLGRHQADAIVSASDESILEVVLRDLEQTMDITTPPTETRISRWKLSFPQYAPGHSQLVTQAEDTLNQSGVFLAGAGYHGIGVPACIASGRRAAHAALSS